MSNLNMLYQSINQFIVLQLLSAVTAMHELLAVEITKCSDDLITINPENLTDWSEKLQVTPALPGELNCEAAIFAL